MAHCISFPSFLHHFNFFNSRSSLAVCLLFRHFFLFCLSFCIACTLLRFRFYNFLQFDFFISLGSISISFPPSPSHIPFDLLSISFNLIVQLPISLSHSLPLSRVCRWMASFYLSRFWRDTCATCRLVAPKTLLRFLHMSL